MCWQSGDRTGVDTYEEQSVHALTTTNTSFDVSGCTVQPASFELLTRSLHKTTVKKALFCRRLAARKNIYVGEDKHC